MSASASSSNTSNSSSESGPSRKKPRHTESKWQASWSKYHLKPSKKGATFVNCTVCNCDFSVAGGGIHEVKRHCNSAKHTQLIKDIETQPSISSAFSTCRPSVDDQVMSAELYFTSFVVEHNLSFATSDHFCKLCKVMFPDSKIAGRFSCGRTKTTAIVTHTLAPAANALVTEACVKGPFSIMCDGGNDKFDKKYFAIMVRYWDDCLDKVVTRFLAMPVCNIASGQSLFDALEAELSSRLIPWKNVVGFASDSASVMVGIRNSVLSRVRAKQPDVFSLACVCHLAALCAASGLKALPFSVDDLLIDIYYHFKHSSKRWQEFADVLSDFDGIVPMRVLKHCTTRWLSLERAVKRLIDLWPVLHAYFDRESEGRSNERVRRVAALLASVETKLFVYFIAFALRPLNSFNTAFQTKATKIGMMQQSVVDLLRSFMANFVKLEVLVVADDMTTINYEDAANQVGDNELGIGTATRLLLVEKEDEVAGTHLERNFFSGVRRFYEKTVAKIIVKFPFKDQTLADLKVLDPRRRMEVTAASIIRLCNRFNKRTPEELDDVLSELNDYRVVPENQLPPVNCDEAGALEHFWFLISCILKPGDSSQKRFINLSQLCKILLVLPHSNADPERLFSMVQKIETDQRGSLKPSTVQDLISVKMNTDRVCYDVNSEGLFTSDFLKSAKSATMRSLSGGPD